MYLVKIFFAGIVGTTLMTVFSYVLGLLFRCEFGEPGLINKLLARSKMLPLQISKDSLWGWGLHYIIGVIFSGFMVLYFHVSGRFPGWGLGSLLGGILGLFGVMAWSIIFRLHSSPPKIDLEMYLLQLIGAHVMFGLGATMIFRIWPS